VLISLMCLKCKTLRPLAQFGLRKMADGAIRNQPWCRGCRSGAGTKKPKAGAEAATAVLPAAVPVPQEAAPVLQVVAVASAAVPLELVPEPVAPALVLEG
jgi:hypothetical protein